MNTIKDTELKQGIEKILYKNITSFQAVNYEETAEELATLFEQHSLDSRIDEVQNIDLWYSNPSVLDKVKIISHLCSPLGVNDPDLRFDHHGTLEHRITELTNLKNKER